MLNNKIDIKQIYFISSKMDRVAQLKHVQDQARELFAKKNKDYGDAFASFGPVGVIVRLGDKIQRLSSITKNSVTLVEDESVRDTLMDLHNYAAMAILLIDEDSKNKNDATPSHRESRHH